MRPWIFLILAFYGLKAFGVAHRSMQEGVIGEEALGTLKVITFNMDRGSNFAYLASAPDATTYSANVEKTLVEVLSSTPERRALGLAAEICKRQPDLVYLSEVSFAKNDTTQPPQTSTVDALTALLNEIKTGGYSYDVLLTLEGEDVVSPAPIPGTGNVAFREREVILFRTDNPDVEVSNPSQGTYQARTKPSTFMPALSSRYGTVDVRFKQQATVRFMGTYLSEDAETQILQAHELAAIVQKTELPLLLVGDFGSDANQDKSKPASGPHATSTYFNLLSEGNLTDVWTWLHSHPGPTWPLYKEDPFIGDRLEPYERVDLNFIKNHDKIIIPSKMDLKGGRKCKAFEPKQRILLSDHMIVVSEYEIHNLPAVAKE